MRDHAPTHQLVRREDHVAEEVQAVRQRPQLHVILQPQVQLFGKKPLDAMQPFHQLRAVVVEQHEIVDVAQVALGAQLVFDELIQCIEIDVG